MQDMPTGPGDHFKLNPATGDLERKSKKLEDVLRERHCHGEVEYLKFRAWLDHIYIHHAEHGPQSKLGIHQWRVDGFARDAPSRPKVFEYNGCSYHLHSHGCLNKNIKATPTNQHQQQLDDDKYQELTDLGFEIDIVWECEWNAVKKVAKALKAGRPVEPALDKFSAWAVKYNEYLAKYPARYFYHVDHVNGQEMLDAIINEKVFGFAKVNIYTRDDLKEQYEDFPPIFKHANVGREDVGSYMADIIGKGSRLLDRKLFW